MDVKTKILLKTYKPVNISEATALKNKKPLHLIGSMEKLKLKGVSDPLSPKQSVEIVLIFVAVSIMMYVIMYFK